MRRPIKKHPQPKPDIRYNSVRVAKFMNCVMREGKRTVAERLVYKAFETVQEKTKKDPIEVFETALHNVGPTMEVRSRRVGGANYQVPREVRPERREQLAMRWIIEAARSTRGRASHLKLADEIIAASKNEGTAFTKRENTHKMAEANKAFAHFAW